MPHVPLHERMTLLLTVIDVHLSAAAVTFMGSFAFPILMLLRPDWAASDDGRIALLLQKWLTATLLSLTFITATCYEWYASDVLQATLRSGPPTSSLTTSSSNLSLSGAVTPRGGNAAGGSGAAAASPAGTPPATGGDAPVSWAFNYVARLSGWVWAPLIAVMYLLAPASWAQTKMMFTDRLKLHLSPKSSPVAPTPGGSIPAAGGSGGGPAASPAVAVSLATGDVAASMGGGAVGGSGSGSGDLEAGSSSAAGGDAEGTPLLSLPGDGRHGFAAGAGGPAGGVGGVVVPPLGLAGAGVGGSVESSLPRGRMGSDIGVGMGLLKAHLTVAGANAAAAAAAAAASTGGAHHHGSPSHHGAAGGGGGSGVGGGSNVMAL
jgi:hypothetical protein